jgi:methyl-accepting chemotaxis protein
VHAHIDAAGTDEIGILASAFNAMVDTIGASIDKITEKEHAALAAKEEAEKAGREMQRQKEYLDDGTHLLLSHMEAFADGDLTARLAVSDDGEVMDRLNDGFNRVVESITRMISDVSVAVSAAMNVSIEISASTEDLAGGALEQTEQAAHVAAAVEEMTKTIMDTTKNAEEAAATARKSGINAREGGRVVMETTEGMVRIADVVKQSAATVQALGRSSDQIGEIVQVIDDIADQTNLLALNAAIEAARAGEQGRGFAVVADEVRKLAERTTKATKEIASMIKQIQHDTLGAVESMNRGTAEVERGRSLAEESGASLREIIAGSERVVEVITQVAEASEKQSVASGEIRENIEAISNVTRKSADGTQQIAGASEELKRMTQKLEELLGRFKFDRSGLGTTARAGGGRLIAQAPRRR